MDFNEMLVDIILNEKYDGDKDIDWLYGEYVRRGYNKSKEMFCEEFVMSMNEREIKYLTEPEVNKVAGGASKFLKSSTSIALASALMAGPTMPTHVSGANESRAVVSDNISKGNHGKSIQGLYKKAPRIINNIFNDKDSETISKLTVGAIVTLMLGTGFIYLISRIVKESTTPAEVLQNTAKGINDILDEGQQEEESNQKEKILTLLKACLRTLLNFVTKEKTPNLEELYGQKFGTNKAPEVFNEWEELNGAFTEVLDAINEKLTMKPENNPLKELFEKRQKNLTEVFDRKEEKKEKEKEKKEKEEKKEEEKEGTEDSVLLPDCDSIFDSDYDVNMGHGPYTTAQLEDNKNVSEGTGIRQDVLDAVDNFVQQKSEGISYTKLGNNSVLVVCKNMTLGDNFENQIREISDQTGKNNLYLVLDNCKVEYASLPERAEIKVLDLRGNTKFTSFLIDAETVEKVLLRNNTENNANQLWLSACGKLGPIYQLSDDAREMDSVRIYLSKCHLAENFKFVNLNSCCDKLLESWCVHACSCPAASLNEILKSFDPASQPDENCLLGL